ncbi:hypothetical protein RI129_009139 [Pyrocoelia pectoralis]|uniref:RING-type domain-containing protein n=1 Tax=Pyrocoelia pectoralis TaxID=417401 RepID=A0AAN7V8M2_9COLE
MDIDDDSVSPQPSPMTYAANRSSTPLPLQSSKFSSDNHLASSSIEHCGDNGSSSNNHQLCPICLESWENFGNHRICVLKCGHYFGYSCIRRWLTDEGKTCPTCKVRSSPKYIRFIYLKKLIVTDYSGLGRLKEELKNVKEEKKEKEIELLRVICRENALKQRSEELKRYDEYLTRVLDQSETLIGTNSNLHVNLYLDKSLELCQNGGCRVIDYFGRDNVLLASVTSSNGLFPGFGAKKIDINTYKPTTYIALHSQAIRDMKFHFEFPWLLSVSLDKTAKIACISSATNSFCTYHSDSPLWSCSWDYNNPNYLYVGTKQGSVLKLDIRQFSAPVCTLDIPGDKCPVLSVISIPPDSNKAIPNGGIISCKLNSVWVFPNNHDQYSAPCSLPLEGPFTYMTYDSNTKQFLISSRPNSHCSYSRYYVGHLDNTPNGLSYSTAHVLKGSKIQTYLSRSCFVNHNSNQFVSVYQESEQNFCLWDVNTGNKVSSAVARDHIFDICNVHTSTNNLIISLTEKKIMFHKFS